ncbi:GATA transcription factor 26-like [Capsicum annuum]
MGIKNRLWTDPTRSDVLLGLPTVGVGGSLVEGHRDGVAGFLLTGTPLWRPGPPKKPVLCNACGSRWWTKGTLDDYVPKHGNRKTQSNQLPSEMKTHLLAHEDQKLEVGLEVSGQEDSLASLEEEMNNISSLGSAGLPSDNCMQMEETNDKDPLWNPESVPRRKRSKLRQLILSPVERLQRQLNNNLQELNFEDIALDDETVTLIYAQNKYIPPNEIGLGAMLLKSLISPTTTERSMSSSPMEEDNDDCTMNVPETRIIK